MRNAIRRFNFQSLTARLLHPLLAFAEDAELEKIALKSAVEQTFGADANRVLAKIRSKQFATGSDPKLQVKPRRFSLSENKN